jgi:hypothetical protein
MCFVFESNTDTHTHTHTHTHTDGRRQATHKLTTKTYTNRPRKHTCPLNIHRQTTETQMSFKIKYNTDEEKGILTYAVEPERRGQLLLALLSHSSPKPASMLLCIHV